MRPTSKVGRKLHAYPASRANRNFSEKTVILVRYGFVFCEWESAFTEWAKDQKTIQIAAPNS